jgi:hypothetical protein
MSLRVNQADVPPDQPTEKSSTANFGGIVSKNVGRADKPRLSLTFLEPLIIPAAYNSSIIVLVAQALIRRTLAAHRQWAKAWKVKLGLRKLGSIGVSWDRQYSQRQKDLERISNGLFHRLQ